MSHKQLSPSLTPVAVQRPSQRLSRFKLMAVALLGMILPGCGFHHAAHRIGDYAQIWAGVQRTVLPNGLTLVTQEIHSSPVICVYVYYKVGSRDEGPHQHGISHLLEHMMFKGSSHFPLGEMDRRFSELGGSYNADTEEDYTSYHETLPASGLETALKVEADRMQNLTVDPAELEHEKTVVLSELDGRDNDPKERLDKAVKKAAFTVHPYQNPVGGHSNEVKALTASQLKQYYHEHYAPNNAVLVVTGDFHTAELRQEVDTTFGSLQRQSLPPRPSAQEPSQREERRVSLFEPGKLSHIEIGYHVPSVGKRDSEVLHVISFVLAAGKTSRLTNDLLNLNMSVGQNATIMESLDPNLFKVTATVRQDRPLSEVENKLEWELNRLETEPVPDAELNAAKIKMIARVVYSHADVSSHASTLGFYSAQGIVQYPERWLENLETVTPAEIQSVARRYFGAENRTVGWLWATGASKANSGSGAKSQPATADETPGDGSTARPLAGHSPDPAFLRAALASLRIHEPVIRQTLPNGLTVLIYPDHASPEISLACGITAGTLFDPSEMPGTAHLALYGLHWGTKTLSGWQLAQQTDEVGANLSPRLDTDRIVLTGQCLKGDLPLTLDVLSDEIRNPAYSASSVLGMKKLLDSVELMNADNPETTTWKSFEEALYPPNSPYHWYVAGTDEIRSRITPAVLHNFHDTYYRPDRTILVIVGDIDKDGALAEVNRTFGSWTKGSATNPPIPHIPGAIPGTRRVFHAVPGAHESRVLMGFAGIERSRPDYYAAAMANEILGRGYRINRLWQHLRQEQGLVYGISSAWSSGLVAGPWTVSFGSSPANVDHAISEVANDMKTLQKSGVSSAELDTHKSSIAGIQALSLQTHEGIASRLLDSESYGLGTDYPWQYPALMAAVTPEEVQQAARQLFHPDDMVVSVAGP